MSGSWRMNEVSYIDDTLLLNSLNTDLGFKFLFDYICELFNTRVHRNASKTCILIEDEDEWNTIVEIHELGFITIECSVQISNLIHNYIKVIPSLIRDTKINQIL